MMTWLERVNDRQHLALVDLRDSVNSHSAHSAPIAPSFIYASRRTILSQLSSATNSSEPRKKSGFAETLPGNMGRSPCCDKGVKKGPWTPEEDIALVSYIQQHGPGNWRAVPIHTGLMRCSKSCRLRWTNYLRPGIKRGNFTPYEDRMIVHLQALLGNRWAAIASYLPQRTDNDIKNYWNTHLKKRLKKMQMEVAGDEINRPDLLKQSMAATSDPSHHHHQNHRTKGQWESRLQTDIHHAKQALLEALNMGSSSSNSLSFLNSNPCSSSSSATTALPNPSSSYAASVENLSRLLEGWNKHSPPIATSTNGSDAANRHHLQDLMTIMNNTNTTNNHNSNSSNNSGSPSCSEGTTHCNSSSQNSEYQSFFNNNNNNSNSNKNSTCEGLVKIETEGGNAQQWASPFNSSFNSPRDGCEDGVSINETEALGPLSEQSQMPLTMLEKWLMEESLQEHLNRTSSSAQIQMGMMMEEPFPDALNHTMVNQPTALPINSRLSSV